MERSKTERLLSLHEELCSTALALMRKKNHDYTGGQDPLRNFRLADFLGSNTLQGILLRMSDKMMRLSVFAKGGGLHVEEETLADTVRDLINYAVLFYYAAAVDRGDR